jgi:hypothetical protein
VSIDNQAFLLERKDLVIGYFPQRNKEQVCKMWLVKAWIDAAKFNLDVQSVVTMRLMKIAAGGATGAAESTRMVQEKAEASAAAVTAGALALAKGRSVKAATKAAMVPVKKRVRANRKRLSGRM